MQLWHFHANHPSSLPTTRVLQSMQIQPLYHGRPSSTLPITYLLSTVVKSCTTQSFIKQMWMNSSLFIVKCLPRCTHSRNNTLHLIFPKLNYKFLVITTFSWLWPLTNTDRWVNRQVTTTLSKGVQLILRVHFLLLFSFKYLYFD